MSADFREIDHIQRVPGEPRRRWFTAPGLDLVVWLNESDALVAFQICYHHDRSEKALTWSAGGGFTQRTVDDGEAIGRLLKSTPILQAQEPVDFAYVAALFEAPSNSLPADVADFVRSTLRDSVP